MAKIEIDGKQFDVKDGIPIIQAADENGIHIPRFCYHKKLSIAGNCRMCLVDVEKAPKALPACATPVMDGMKISTQSKRATDAQKAVMEFLLINHPLDCPICDQGGQCELQDLAMGYGASTSNYTEAKRAVRDPDLGPLIATDMTRCIHCTRCVRFGEEIAGERELGATNRGEHMTITTYVKHTVNSELSGNVIDICPVGALTSKPFRFKARAWELDQTASIAPHDCLGSNVNMGVLRGELLRVNPKENEAINEVWLSDRDRFSYVGVHSENRLLKPMVKTNGKWQKTDWQTAFDRAVAGLKKAGSDIGALVSPSATLEEMFLLQKVCRGLGSDNIDYRLRQTDFSDQASTPLGSPLDLGVEISELENRDAILLVGSDIRHEQPLAGLRVRKAALKGAKIFAINSLDVDFNFDIAGKLIAKPSALVDSMAGVAKAALEITGKSDAQAENLLKDIVVTDVAAQMAKALCETDKATIVFGAFAINHPQAAVLRYLGRLIANLSDATMGCLTEGANAQGAELAGCVPHRGAGGSALAGTGLNAQTMLQNAQKAYVLLGAEPEYDCANPSKAIEAFKQADCVIALSAFVTEQMKEYADVILPMASLGETSGTFVNVEGQWQGFAGCVKAKGEARPAWKILRVLGNLLALDGFDYFSSEDVLKEIKACCDASDHKAECATWPTPKSLPKTETKLERMTTVPMYRVDALVRQSEPLQKMLPEDGVVKINAHMAQQLKIKADQNVTVIQGPQTKRLSVLLDECVPNDCLLLAGATESVIGLGDAFGVIDMKA